MNFIINRNNFQFEKDITKPIELESDIKSKSSITNILINKNNIPKKKPIVLDDKITTKNFDMLLLNLDLNKNDKEFITKIYYNILENIVTYSILCLSISQLFLCCIVHSNDINKSGEITSIVKRIKKLYCNYNIDLDTQKSSIYNVIKVVDNENIYNFKKYLETQNKHNQELEKKMKDGTLIYENVSIPKKYLLIKDPNGECINSAMYNFNKFIKDENHIKYSKYTKNQNREYSFYQTIAQPLVIENNNCKLGNGNEELDNTQICEFNDSNNTFKGFDIVNNKLDNIYGSATYEPNIFLPKFLKNNTLEYNTALKNRLNIIKQKNTPDKIARHYENLFRKLYINSQDIWDSPPDISGDLDMDIQIKELEKRLKIIKIKTINNYKLLASMKSEFKNYKDIIGFLKKMNDDKKTESPISEAINILKQIEILDDEEKYIPDSTDYRKPLTYSIENGEIILSNCD